MGQEPKIKSLDQLQKEAEQSLDEYLQVSRGQDQLLGEFRLVFKACETGEARLAAYRDYSSKMQKIYQRLDQAWKKWRLAIEEFKKKQMEEFG